MRINRNLVCAKVDPVISRPYSGIKRKPHHQLLTADEQRASPGSALHTRSVKRAVSDQKLSLVHCLASDSDHYLNNTESLILPIEPASCR
ncbi:unnamed protein product, partial [Mesorhabditis spiculigera]